MWCEECQAHIWKAGERVPAGTYLRIDDESSRIVVLLQEGPLPASFDGHVALYRTAPWRDTHTQTVSSEQMVAR